jgi:simple sugar transport system permease protein
LFGVPAIEGSRLIAQGSFGDGFALSRTLTKFAPLVLTGLGMAVAWRARMYNIGGEGQFIVGGLCAAGLASSLPNVTGPMFLLALTATACLGGALFACFAGWLYVARGVQLVVSTILLNFIALQLLSWAVAGPLQRAKRDIPATERLHDSLRYVRFNPQTDLHAGIAIGILCVVFVWVFLARTYPGFRLRVVGENPNAARAQRMPVARSQIIALAISGGLCGLAAACEFQGVSGSLDKGFSQNWGFLGIPVALLGGLHPVGTAAAGIYFSALLAGSENLARFSQGGSTIVFVVQSVAVLAVVGLRSWLAARPVKAAEL